MRAIATYLPSGRLTNEELAAELGEWDAHKIYDKTGIRVRRIAAPGECASDLGVAAAERLFATGVCGRSDIDFLILCTQTPDYLLPSTSCGMQHRLGLRIDCGAFDFNQGCSGFVYGLALAKGLIESAGVGHVLLITAETYSKHLNPADRSVRTIFGDGAAATLVSAADGIEDGDAIGPFVFGTDGRGGCNLIVPAGGAREPIARSPSPVDAQPGSDDGRQFLYMNGPEVFNFTLTAVPAAVAAVLAKAGIHADAVDLFVFHQANKFMLERLRAKLRIPNDRFWIDMAETGNTVSATIPIALEQATQRGRLRPGADLMLVGFGVGYSWAAAMVKACWL